MSNSDFNDNDYNNDPTDPTGSDRRREYRNRGGAGIMLAAALGLILLGLSAGIYWFFI